MRILSTRSSACPDSSVRSQFSIFKEDNWSHCAPADKNSYNKPTKNKLQNLYLRKTTAGKSRKDSQERMDKFEHENDDL